MEKLLINTPQNVRIEYKLASVGSRLFALILDYGVMVAYGFLVIYLLSDLIDGISDTWLAYGLFSLLLLPIFLYHFILESLLGGQTLGKLILKIKVVKLDGSRASVYEYFIRWAMNIVDVWMMGGVIGLISIILSKQSQRVGDMAAGTSVINLKPQLALQQTIYEDLANIYHPLFPESRVNRLSDLDVNIIKKTFHKAIDQQNEMVMDELAKKISKVTGIELKEMNNAEFTQTILKDHYYYNSDV